MANTETTKYLIIGNSAGGIGAAEAIRQVDKAGAITIISGEPYPAYSRPLISEHLAEHCPLERMLFRPYDFYEKNNIRTMLGQKAERLDLKERTIELKAGGMVSWEKILIATGGSPIVPQIKEVELNGVFTFTTLNDARAIDQYIKGTFKAVVIGGGLIGISVTEALLKRGVSVTIVEMRERVLNILLDEEASFLEEETLKRAGVEIITGRTVSKITSHSPGAATGVTLDDGRPIPCNLVVVAIGVRPRTELVSGTGIKVNRGIVVDRNMETSNHDVYACGDVAEAHDFIHNECRLSPIWPNAYLGGRVAGFNMAGVPTEYPGGTAMNALKYFGLSIVSAGMVMPSGDGYEIVSKKNNHSYKKVVLKDGIIKGLVFTEDIEKSGIVYGLMKDKVDVSAFKHTLTASDFGLASLPEEMWRPKLEKPSSVTTSSVVPAEHTEEAIAGE